MSVRPRFQRAFLAWLEEVRPRLALQPRLSRRTDEVLRVQFDGFLPEIEAEIIREPRGSSCSIFIRPVLPVGGPAALLYLDTDVVATPVGYIFPYDTAASPRSFPSREEAWRDLLFEPFLTWISDKLALADAIAVLRSEDFILGDPDRGLWSYYPRLMADGELLSPVPPGYALERVVKIRVDQAASPSTYPPQRAQRQHSLGRPPKAARLTKLRLRQP